MAKIKLTVGVLGAVLLLFGVFLPAIKVPFLGNATYLEYQEIEAYALITLGILTLVLIAVKKQKILWFTGFSSLGVLAYSYIQLQNILTGKNTQMESDFGSLYKEFAGMMQDIIQLQWGVGVLLAGSVLIIFAAALKGKTR